MIKFTHLTCLNQNFKNGLIRTKTLFNPINNQYINSILCPQKYSFNFQENSHFCYVPVHSISLTLLRSRGQTEV